MRFAKVFTDILSDPKLMSASRKGKVRELTLLPWLIVFAKLVDDDGRLTINGEVADPEDIAAMIPCTTARKVTVCIAELAALGVLVLDDADANIYRFTAWDVRAGVKPSDGKEAINQRVARHREKKRRERNATLADGETPLGNALQGVSDNATEKEVEVEKEKEVEYYGASPDAPGRGSAYPPEFEATWVIYPKRAGKADKPGAFKAWSARRRAGVPAAEMHAGVERYARFCDATGKIGTETVMQAKTFFGPSECWTEMYELPVAPAGVAPPSPAETLWARYVKIGVNHRLPREEFVRKGEELVRQGAYPSVEAFLDELRVTQPWTIDPKTADRFAVATIAGRLAELPNLQKAS